MLKDLIALTSQTLSHNSVPLAAKVEKNIPIYDCAALSKHLNDPGSRSQLMSELTDVLLNRSGTFVLKGAYADTQIIDKATDAFHKIIAHEKQSEKSGADHFAASGANDRVWNSLEKLCYHDTDTFIRYHSNPWIELASLAWLGPAYQVTAQVNLVRPGGKAQEAHCDYHLGFMTKDQVETYPPHVHRFGDQLTLQGAVAHVDMPIESGTTKLLPFSQNWKDNYRSFREPEVRAHFEEACVQLPLAKGDLLFFSPGLLHGAGENFSADVDRMANLLQISSAFGIPLEAIGREAMARQVYPALLECDLTDAEMRATVASTAEGYPFSTNLDTDPPVGGLAPKSQQQLMLECLENKISPAEFNSRLDAQQAKRAS